MIKKTLALAALLAAGAAQAATVIDFESVAVGPTASFTVSGVTFSGSLTVSDDGNGIYVNAAPGTHFLDNRFGGSDFTFTLAAPTDYFGLQIGATNDAQTLSAFDSANNLLGSVAIPNQVGTLPQPYTGFYELSFNGIAKVTLTGQNGDWVVVDNVTVGAVPEPETYALMIAGLAAVGVVARRRRAA